MSLVLAFDTATEDVALALGRLRGGTPASDSQRPLAQVALVGGRDFHAPRAALSRLLPAVSELLSETGTEAVSISAVVVGRGPGSFTGVRIGVSTAKGLAHALGARLYGVGTLDAIAWGFAEEERIVGIVGDAMRGEVYPALFRCGGGTCRRLTDDAVTSPAEAARAFAQGWEAAGGHDRMLLAGDGMAKHAQAFREILGDRMEAARRDTWAPTGASLLRAAEALAEGDGDPAALLPVYTRLSDAEENERRKATDAGVRSRGGM